MAEKELQERVTDLEAKLDKLSFLIKVAAAVIAVLAGFGIHLQFSVTEALTASESAKQEVTQATEKAKNEIASARGEAVEAVRKEGTTAETKIVEVTSHNKQQLEADIRPVATEVGVVRGNVKAMMDMHNRFVRCFGQAPRNNRPDDQDIQTYQIRYDAETTIR